MADEITPDVAAEESIDDLWKRVGLEDDEEAFSSEEEDAEAEAEREDKVLKKMSARLDDMEKKNNQYTIKATTTKFLEGASDLEKEFFNVAAGEVKGDPDKLIHVIKLAQENAAKAQVRIDAAEQAAKEQVQRAWGGASPGMSSSVATPDEEAELQKRILAGGPQSSKAALKLWLKDSSMAKFID